MKVRPFDFRWMLPSRIDDSGPVWLLQVDGIIVDVRTMPRAVQEQAFRKKRIPWIPADREAAPTDEA